MQDLFSGLVQEVAPQVIAFRRELHAHPELSFQEHETARRIRDRLGQIANLQVLPPYIETDVVAVLNADMPGPCILLRADIDALPIQEETGVPYASTRQGVMHACGHDGHAATLLGTAMVLSRVADQLPGKVKFVFQPAEEDGGGGGVLCERGVLDEPKVDAAVALHAWPYEPVGSIAIRPGWVMAASNPFKVSIQGVGSHGAYPHRGIDSIVVAAHIITALQTIVSRTIDPQDAAVVTIGQIHAGTAENIIPARAEMEGTMRYTRLELGEQLRQRLSRIIEHTAQAHGATARVEIIDGYPPMYNDDDLSALITTTGRELLGEANVVTAVPVSMGVEDFAYYAQKVPAAMFRLGVRPVASDSYPSLHNPAFNFNDDALPIGIRMFCEIATRFLRAGGRGTK
ncbi:MAG TPA: M20 family metallopeptidase [Phycisphaerae bacterium]|nr:M20 family metallopeptidase [Phycisphaerae bacterium]